MRCSSHRTTNCTYDRCRRERLRRAPAEATAVDPTDIAAPLGQATYGGYVPDDGSGQCNTSSSYDSGSSSSSDSGSSSGSCD